MTVLKSLILIISIIILLALFGVKYWTESPEPDSVPTMDVVQSNVVKNLPENAGISELMDAMTMYKVKEPWDAMQFELDSVRGDKVRLDQLRGKIVLLSFWTTW
jgi:cytochrome oxidase Cu insertion factor (SCO1/SenC/PrrC family)